MIKSDILRMQHQFLDEFRKAGDSQRRKALLEVIKSLEKVATTYKDKESEMQGKSPLQDPAFIDPCNALKKTCNSLMKGEVSPSLLAIEAELAMLKEACRPAI